jgi:rod shape-determining protein MreD
VISTRAALAGLAVSVALVLQLSVFSQLSWHGVVPNLVLLVVVAAALVRGAEFGMVLGFAGGVLLDLAPPADHVAGRWALALLLVGYVAGRVAQDTRFDAKPAALVVLATVGASSFLGTSVFALSGVVLRDPPLAVPDLLQVIFAALVWDLLLTPLVLPGVMLLFTRLEPERAT